MPPKIKISHEDIITGAIQIVREQGMEAVNARSVAAKLNCSIQPIFRTFGTMEDLKAAVYRRAMENYMEMMHAEVKQNEDSIFEIGLAYVNFARREQNLFRLLLMSNLFSRGSASDIVGSTVVDDEIIALIGRKTGFHPRKARELFTGTWFTLHGIASFLATNHCGLGDDEIKRIIKSVFDGLICVLKETER